MTERKGEKIGWLAGWFGGFLWIGILSVVFLVQHKTLAGISGLALFSASLVSVFWFAPWRHPATPYWRLMLPIYLFVFGAIFWAVMAYGGLKEAGLLPTDFFWIIALLIPFGTVGRRKWDEAEKN